MDKDKSREMYKEKFYNSVIPFVESGVMTELYECSTFSIYKVENHSYYAFYYLDNPAALREDCVGIALPPKILDIIINNNETFSYCIGALGADYYNKNHMALNEHNLKVLLDFKNNPQENSKYNFLDLEWEENFKNKGKKI